MRVERLVKEYYWAYGLEHHPFLQASYRIQDSMKATVNPKAPVRPELRVLIAKLRVLGVDVRWHKEEE